MEKNIKTHKDLDVWKESMKLAKDVYLLTSSFPKEELFVLTLQIRRSSISIPSNIAEGAARNSNKDFVKFLYVALGSLAELETQLLLAKELGFINENSLESSINSIRKMLIGLIKYLSKNQ